MTIKTYIYKEHKGTITVILNWA